MSQCQQCGGRAQQGLCTRCTGQLSAMLLDLGWLIGELEVTATRQDRLTAGISKRVEHPCPANMDALELLRSVTRELHGIVNPNTTLPMAASPRLAVWWLREHLDTVVAASNAGRVYRVVARMVGFNSPGPIHDVINRPDTRFAGECPDCGELCYSRHEDVYTACPYCEMPVDVERNRTRTVIEYDLLPEKALLDVLDNLGEHVSRVKFYSWVKAGTLPVAGYLSASGTVTHKGGPRDPRVYSLSRARALRRREQTSQLGLAYA